MNERRKKLIEDNYNFIYFKLNKWKTLNTSLDNEELLQLCYVGITKAGVNFDFSRGLKFITFASVCIDNEIKMELRKSESKLQQRCNTFTDMLISYDDTGVEVYHRDLIEKLEVDDKTIIVDDMISVKEIIEKELTDREKIIFIKSFFENKNQREIAKEINITQSYVCRILKRASKKVRLKIKAH